MLLALFCALSVATASPWFCHDINCPNYSIVKNTSSYEIRKYPSTSWVSTDVKGLSWKTSVSSAFMKLFGFISGSNDKQQKIPMTAPVISKVSPGQGPNCENDFVVSFFLPYNLQGKPLDSLPQPTDSTVYLSNYTAMTVAVKSFGGFASDDDVTTNIADLGNALEQDHISFDQVNYFTAGYDSPFRVFHRHNEVWLVVNQ